MNSNKRILLSIMIAFFSCGHKQVKTVFLFFPSSNKDLLQKGYRFDSKFQTYRKTVGDTLEVIWDWNEDARSFSKQFYISAPDGLSLTAKEDNLDKIIKEIISRADSLYLNQRHTCVFKVDGYNLALFAGYSASGSSYRISLISLNSSKNRNDCITQLEQLKKNYTGIVNADSVDLAIKMIKGLGN